MFVYVFVCNFRKKVDGLSYLVCHVEKYKARQVAPIGHHNNRDSDKHSNLDIDPELKDKNFNALTGAEGNPQVNYNFRLKEIIKSEYKVRKKPRYDAVMMVGIVVTSDVFFFRELELPEIKRFFFCAATFLSEKYGKNNMIDCKVHMDETTPHMHYEFVPISEGHLSARRFFDKWKLQMLQSEFAKYMQEQNFKLERGEESSGMRHIPIPELKKETFRAMHDYEVQEEVMSSINEGLGILIDDLKKNGLYEKHENLFTDLPLFMGIHRKMVFEAAHYLRKKREYDDVVARLKSEKKKLTESYKKMRELLKAQGLKMSQVSK